MKLTEKDRARFWSKVEKTGDCWIWRGSINNAGYGVFWYNPDSQNRSAHRMVFAVLGQEAPPLLDHLCRNRACVNPAHLEGVTHKVNLLRGETLAAANAAKTHCPKGHEYTLENTYRISGRRVCRTCSLATSVAGHRRRHPEAVGKGNHTRKPFCIRGHPLTDETVYVSPKGKRNCRECVRLRTARYEARH